MRWPWQLGRAVWQSTNAFEWRSRIDLFEQGFADHANRRGVTAGQALDEFHAVISIRAHRHRLVNSIVAGRSLDAEVATQIVHQLKAAGHRAAQCAADANMRFAGRLAAKHEVEGHQLQDVDRLQAELLCDPEHRLVADKAEVFLPQMQ